MSINLFSIEPLLTRFLSFSDRKGLTIAPTVSTTAPVLTKLHNPSRHGYIVWKYIQYTVLPAKSDSDFMIYLQRYSLPKLTLDWLIFAKIFVIFVRFREVLRPWSRFYREYEHNVNSLMQMVW